MRPSLLLPVFVFLCCAYFFQGGGWNQNAHFATTVALVEDGTFHLDRYRESSGDLARTNTGVPVSAKAAGTALASVPAYLVAKLISAPLPDNGNRIILRAYLTSLFGTGLALALFALVLLRLLRRYLGARDAVSLTLALTLATPLFPNSTMMSSAPFVALFALLAVELLHQARAAGATPGRLWFWAGVAGALPTAFEYTTALLLPILGLYLLYHARDGRKLGAFATGVAAATTIPMLHHTVVFGHPFSVGYAAMANAGMAAAASSGFFGFDHFSWGRLYDLTLGDVRGFVFMSPFLVAIVPGAARMLRHPTTRPEGLLSVAVVTGFLAAISCLSYWHSGWGLGSRYALLAVVFAALPIAAVYPTHRGWMHVGMAIGYVTMFMAAAVTATPPPPPTRPARATVTGWLWQQLCAGKLNFRHERVLHIQGLGDGHPTWPVSFNLGCALGLEGLMSLLPLAVIIVVFVVLMRRALRRQVLANAGEPAAHLT